MATEDLVFSRVGEKNVIVFLYFREGRRVTERHKYLFVLCYVLILGLNDCHLE